MNKFLCAGFLVFFVAGCSTTAVPLSAAKEAPKNRVFQNATNGDAQITVIRDQGGFVGTGCDAALSVNNKLVAVLQSAEYVTVPVPSGEILLKVARHSNGGLCSINAGDWVQREMTPVRKNGHF